VKNNENNNLSSLVMITLHQVGMIGWFACKLVYSKRSGKICIKSGSRSRIFVILPSRGTWFQTALACGAAKSVEVAEAKMNKTELAATSLQKCINHYRAESGARVFSTCSTEPNSMSLLSRNDKQL